jgi:hypothetical protein
LFATADRKHEPKTFTSRELQASSYIKLCT